MKSIRATLSSVTGETPKFLMFRRELSLPDTLISGVTTKSKIGQSEYTENLKKRLETAYQNIRSYQGKVRSSDTQEPPLYSKNELVLLKSFRQKKGTTAKLRRKYVGPYIIKEVYENHTYLLERNGKMCREHENRLKPFRQSPSSWSKATTEGEPNRQPTRAGYHANKKSTPSALERFLENEELSLNQRDGAGENRLNTEVVPSVARELNSATDSLTEVNSSPSTRVVPPPARDLNSARGNSASKQDGVRNPSSANEGVVPSSPATTRSGQAVRRPKTLEAFVTNSLSHDPGISTANKIAGFKLTPIKVSSSGYSILSTSTRLGSTLFNRQQSYIETAVNPLQFITTATKEMASNLSYDTSVLDIMEEGELSDVSTDSHEGKKSSKYDLTTNRTHERARELMELLKVKKTCCLCQRELGSRKDEALRVHVWSHLVIFACRCGYFASRYDTVKHHHDANHGKTTKTGIYKIDRPNWDIARDLIPLPTRMPSLPLDKKVTFNKKENKENLSPRKSPKKKAKTILEEMVPKDRKAKLISPIKTPTKPTNLKITKIESSRTVGTQTSPIKTDDDVHHEQQVRRFIQSQNIISNELRKMAAVVEAQTDTFRQYIAKYESNTHG